MTSSSERNRSEPENARTRVSETPAPTASSPDRSNSHRANPKRAHTRVSEKQGEPSPSSAGELADGPNTKSARARVSENQDEQPTEQPPLQVVAQRGDVTGEEHDFLANGFGYALRKLREIRGMTQHQVRGLAGISVGYLSMLERGHRRPTYDAIHAIARALAPFEQQAEVADKLIELAGDSIRESAARKKRRATSRAVVRQAAFLKQTVAKMERQVDHLRDTGQHWMADDIEKTATSLREQLAAREEAARAQLSALGDDPNDPSITRRRTPKHFRKRSYGPRNRT